MRNDVLATVPANWFTREGLGPDNYEIHIIDMNDPQIDMCGVSLRVRFNPRGICLSSSMNEGGFYLEEEQARALRDALTKWIDAIPTKDRR